MKSEQDRLALLLIGALLSMVILGLFGFYLFDEGVKRGIIRSENSSALNAPHIRFCTVGENGIMRCSKPQKKEVISSHWWIEFGPSLVEFNFGRLTLGKMIEEQERK